MDVTAQHLGTRFALIDAAVERDSEIPEEGFVRRQMFAWCEHDLKAGRDRSTFFLNDRKLNRSEMQAFVEYARRWGFLPRETT